MWSLWKKEGRNMKDKMKFPWLLSIFSLSIGIGIGILIGLRLC